jgi:hypothetical protein
MQKGSANSLSTMVCAPEDADCVPSVMRGSHLHWFHQDESEYRAARLASGSVQVQYRLQHEREPGAAHRITLIRADGVIPVGSYPTQRYGDKTFHGSSVERVGDYLTIKLVYRWHDVRNFGEKHLQTWITTPASNLESVRERFTRPTDLLLLTSVVGLVFAGSSLGVFASDFSDGIRYGVGIPLFAIGAAVLSWSTYGLTRPQTTLRTLPPNQYPSPSEMRFAGPQPVE